MDDAIRTELAAAKQVRISPGGEVFEESFVNDEIDALIPIIREERAAQSARPGIEQTESALRTEYLTIMRECRDNTATAARVRRGLYLVMRLAARTYFAVNE